jgi:glycosyltransferase involved in cell wall biosynthesis
MAVSGVSEHLRQLMAAPFQPYIVLSHFQVGSEGRRETSWQRRWRLITSPFQLALTVLRSGSDIIHINTSLNRKAFWRDVVYLAVSKVLGRKVVFQVHGGSLPTFLSSATNFQRNFIAWLVSWADVLVVLSKKEKKHFAQMCTRSRLIMIRNGIDVEKFGIVGQKAFEHDVTRVVYLGRIHRDKGVLDIVEAAALLRAKGRRHITYMIAGLGPDEAVLAKRIEELGMQYHVHLLGAVHGEEKLELWRTADLFVLPSHHEGLPYALLESLASGTPIVTTRVGAIPEVVVDGRQAIFVEPGHSAMLADAIDSLVGSRNLLRSMSAHCLKTAHELFGAGRLAQEFERTYQSIVGIRG